MSFFKKNPKTFASSFLLYMRDRTLILSILYTPHSGTQESGLHQTNFTYMPYLRTIFLSPQTTHTCTVTWRTLPCLIVGVLCEIIHCIRLLEECRLNRTSEHGLISNVPEDIQRTSVFNVYVRRAGNLHYATELQYAVWNPSMIDHKMPQTCHGHVGCSVNEEKMQTMSALLEVYGIKMIRALTLKTELEYINILPAHYQTTPKWWWETPHLSFPLS